MKEESKVRVPLPYDGVFMNFADLWRKAKLIDKTVVFWNEKRNGIEEAWWGNIIGFTYISGGNDVLLHVQASEEGSMIFIPLSTVIGKRGFEIRAKQPEEKEKPNG